MKQIGKFTDAMHEKGCGPAAGEVILADNKRHRYRVDGDKKVSNGVYCLTVQPDGFAVGWFINHREGKLHKWHMRSSRDSTPEERADWKERQAVAAKKREDEQRELADRAALKAQRLWDNAATHGESGYLKRKFIGLCGARLMRGSVVVPVMVRGELRSLQFIAEDGSKRFLSGGDLKGGYHIIPGTRNDNGHILAEGFATGAAINRATDMPVVVAFNASNMVDVARQWTFGTLHIAADNDQWTFEASSRPQGVTPSDVPGDDPMWAQWRQEERLVNPGLDYAMQAAGAAGGGIVLVPPIDANDAKKRTDWWDVWVHEGNAGLLSLFQAKIGAVAVIEHEEPVYESEYPDADPIDDDRNAGWDGPPADITAMVRPLGHNEGKYYFFPRSCGQIREFTPSALGVLQNLASMATIRTWMSHFGTDNMSEKKMAMYASIALIEECNRIGVYNPDKIRSIGAWMDGDQAIFNTGDKIYHGRGWTIPPDYISSHVYVMSQPIDSPLTGLSNRESSMLLDLCKSLKWENPQHAYMLAGWIVVAQIAGALRWKPHIVLTGDTGAGKSWVVENIIKTALGDAYISRDGGTSEAALRNDISGKSIPVIMDEAESESTKEKDTMTAIFSLARKSSDSKTIANFNGVYSMQSCFCFSAINPNVTQAPDLARMAFLKLRKAQGKDADAEFKALCQKQGEVLTEDFHRRLLGRSLDNIHVLRANIEAFSEALGDTDGGKRFGDQFGTLIAGAFSLTTSKPVTVKEAREWVEKQDWSWAHEDAGEKDGDKLLGTLMSLRVRYDYKGQMKESSISRLINATQVGNDEEMAAACTALGEYGIKVDSSWLYVASPNISLVRMLKDSTWSSELTLKNGLLKLPGSGTQEKVRFSSSLRKRGVKIPLSLAWHDENEDD